MAAVEFAAWLRDRRLEQGLTQSSLAKALGLKRGTAAMWEQGRNMPSGANWTRLEDVLGTYPSGQEDAPFAGEIVDEGLGQYFGPLPADSWKEDAEAVACVYVFYDGLGRPVRVGQTSNLKSRMDEYQRSFWWFRPPTVTTYAYVVVSDEVLRKQVEAVIIKLLGTYVVFNTQHATKPQR
jgi:transcriptional regulator with XRE-family HTH domain